MLDRELLGIHARLTRPETKQPVAQYPQNANHRFGTFQAATIEDVRRVVAHSHSIHPMDALFIGLCLRPRRVVAHSHSVPPRPPHHVGRMATKKCRSKRVEDDGGVECLAIYMAGHGVDVWAVGGTYEWERGSGDGRVERRGGPNWDLLPNTLVPLNFS